MQYYYQYQPGINYYKPRLFRGAVRTIIFVNILIYLLMLIPRIETTFVRFLGLVPRYVLKGYLWQLFTYLFIHGGFWHLFWNMFVLWIFGTEIENYWGRKGFLKYYFITGVGSGIITALVNYKSGIPVIGASGAIYGILIAFGLLFPERYIFLYFLIPIKAKYFVWIMAAITFISTLSPGTSNISHLTHLAGILIGFLYLRRSFFTYRWRFVFSDLLWRLRRIFSSLSKIPKRIRFKTKPKSRKIQYDTEETMREELDRILDLISKYGYDSLTEKDKTTLLLLSKYFAEKDKYKN